VRSGEFHQRFRSGRHEARWHAKRGTKQNEMKQDSMGKDEMKQDSMGNDAMKHDQMTEGKKQKKAHKSKKESKRAPMGKNEMKHGDNVKQSDSMQKDEMQH
jgi:hypothetical protein